MTKTKLTDGYGPDHRRLVAEYGDGPYRAIITLEEAAASRFGLALMTVVHLNEPPFAGMEIDLEGDMAVQLVRRMSQPGQPAPGTGGKWHGRPFDRAKPGAHRTTGAAPRKKSHTPRGGHH